MNSSPPLKVCFFSHSARRGGAEYALLELLCGFHALGWDVHAVFPRKGDLQALIQGKGIPTHITRYARWASRSRRPRQVFKRFQLNVRGVFGSRRLLKQIKPDIVLSNTLTTPSGAIAARSLGIPHVWFIHEFGDRDHGLVFDFGKARTLKWIDRLSACMITNSNAVRRSMAQYMDPSRLRLVRYAVEVAAPSPPSPPVLDNSVFRLGMAGTLSTGKGQHIAVAALASLKKRGFEPHLHFIGGGDGGTYQRELEALASQLDVREQLHFEGYTRQPEKWFARFPVTLVCSREEAFGRVTIEAMKMGATVLGSESGGTIELIRDGWNGLLFPVSDPEALAHCIERVHTDAELLRELRMNALRWSREQFCLDYYLADVGSVLRESLSKTDPGHQEGPGGVESLHESSHLSCP